ncbi:MAG: hypothetical protein HamCj_02170 [Candidatus Hamiltonella defensa (Ceratovacuna japonica)]
MSRYSIAFLLTFFSYTAFAAYNFDDLCGNSWYNSGTYNKKEGIVTSVASSAFSSKLSHGGGVVVTIDGSDGRVQRYVYKQYSYNYSYNPLVKIAFISYSLKKRVKVCYDDTYLYVMELQP